MATISTLKVVLSGDASPLRKSLKRAEFRVNRFSRKIDRMGANVGKIFAKAGIAATALAGSYFALARSAARADDEIAKLSKRTGIGVSTLSKLQHAASLSDASIQDLGKGMRRMASSIVNANRGMASYSRAFDAMNINTEKLVKLSPEEQFMTVAKALSEIEDKTLRYATAQEVLGRSGTQLLPMINNYDEMLSMMREAEELGLVVSDEDARQAERFNDSLVRVSAAVRGLVRGGTSLSKMSDLFEKIAGQLAKFRQSGAFEKLTKSVTNFVSNSITNLMAFMKVWSDLSPALKKQIVFIGGLFTALGVAWMTGFIGPFMRTIVKIPLMVASNIIPILGIFTGLASFLVGLKIGKVLEESFGLSNLLTKVILWSNKTVDTMAQTGEMLIELATEAGERLTDAFLPGNWFEDTSFQDIVNKHIDASEKIQSNYEQRIAILNAEIEKEPKRIGFIEAAKKEFSKEQLGKDFDFVIEKFKGVALPDSLKEFILNFKAAKIEFADAPAMTGLINSLDNNSLAQSDNTDALTQPKVDIAKLGSAAAVEARLFGFQAAKGISTPAMRDTKKSDDVVKEIKKGNAQDVERNTILQNVLNAVTNKEAYAIP